MDKTLRINWRFRFNKDFGPCTLFNRWIKQDWEKSEIEGEGEENLICIRDQMKRYLCVMVEKREKSPRMSDIFALTQFIRIIRRQYVNFAAPTTTRCLYRGNISGSVVFC